MTSSARAAGRANGQGAGRFQAYVPGVLVDWLADGPTTAYRALDGTLVFADISGFTQFTERLARAGKVGAEEISQVLDTVFIAMLDAAYLYGADLIKWAGDAVLLFFDGPDHAARACAAVGEMRATLRLVGKVRGTSASASLKLSAGVHSGELLLFLVGTGHQELILAGPSASLTAQLQRAAPSGQIAISLATAAMLDPGLAGEAVGPGLLLRTPPRVDPGPDRQRPDPAGLGLGGYLPVAVAEQLRAGQPDGEHRRVAVSFVQFTGTDDLLAEGGPERLSAALQHVVGVAQAAAQANDVTFLETDICPGGGNIMLVAGAPRSAGRDEERLLATVRAILDRPGALAVRAGLNAGRVFTGHLGPSYRRAYSVKGDAVNLAARLTAQAAAGELLATAAALDRSEQGYQTSPVPPFRVKGKAAPVQAFRVAGRARRAVAETGSELVGRDGEVATLREALGSLQRGHGGVIELSGEPGIGKSRLLSELLTMADAMRSIVIRCDPYGSSTPYAVAGNLFRELLGEPGESAPGTVVTALEAAVRSRVPHLLRWLPLLATVVGADLPLTVEVAQLDPEFRRPRLEEAVTELLRSLLSGPAVLLAIEDAQFADEPSASLLARLLSETADRAWLIVVATVDPARSAFHLPDDAPVTRLALGPLPDDAVQALLLGATEQAPLPPHQLAAIGRRGAGNPMFLRELAAMSALDRDLEVLPESVEGVIAVEIDRLATADRSTLRAAAVVGTSFDPDLLTGVLGGRLDRGVLSRLRAFVVPEAAGTYRFRHALVRDAAYEGLPFARRRQLHARLAEAVERRAGDKATAEAAALSLHFFHAQRYQAAAYYARIAGEQAAAAYANPEAAGFLTRALESVKRGQQRSAEDEARLAEALGDIRYRLGEFSEAARSFAEARAASRLDPVAVARLCEKTALAVARTSGSSAALRWTSRGRRALAGLTGHDADRQEALLLVARALLRYRQGRYAEAAVVCSEAVALADRCGARDVLARALYVRDVADVARGQYLGERWAEQALAIWRDLGNLSWQARALNVLGARAYFEGRWDDALSYFRQAVDAHERTGDQWNAAIAAGNVGEILSNQGRYDEAERALRPAERVLRASGALAETAFVSSVLGLAAARAGQPAAALRLLEEARASYLKAGEPDEVAATEVGIAEALIYAGRAEEARSRTEELSATPLARPGQPNASALARVRGYALARLGLTSQARQALAESLDAARSRGDAYDEALAADGLIRLLETSGQALDPDLPAQRDELFRKLGLVTVPAPSTSRETHAQ
ncbi:MAG TPA: adenylate/guanylate cyclase domain-containing protein [Trebonia sp.]|nr:adenylate/guanylate cyclase domain-containing protein [Trebonia sp.]